MNTNNHSARVRQEAELTELDLSISEGLRTLARAAAATVVEARRTCVHCVHYAESPNPHARPTCALYNMAPPDRVIAFGCPEFSYNVVPF